MFLKLINYYFYFYSVLTAKKNRTSLAAFDSRVCNFNLMFSSDSFLFLIEFVRNSFSGPVGTGPGCRRPPGPVLTDYFCWFFFFFFSLRRNLNLVWSEAGRLAPPVGIHDFLLFFFCGFNPG